MLKLPWHYGIWWKEKGGSGCCCDSLGFGVLYLFFSMKENRECMKYIYIYIYIYIIYYYYFQHGILKFN